MLHVSGVSPAGGLLTLVLALAGLGSGLVVVLALAALARRRSLSYFLVTVALATMLTRTVVGILGVNHVIGELPHHLLEHSLDVFTVVLLLGAVYAARTVNPRSAPLTDGGDGDAEPARVDPTEDGGSGDD